MKELVIEKVNYELGEYFEGCETCDYGSSYLSNLTIKTDKCTIKFEFDKMYDYVSESDIMKMLSMQYLSEFALIEQLKDNLDLENLKVEILYEEC